MKKKILTRRERTSKTWDGSAELLLVLVHRPAEKLCCLTLMKIKMLMKVLRCDNQPPAPADLALPEMLLLVKDADQLLLHLS